MSEPTLICDFCLADAPLVKDYEPSPDQKLIAHLPGGALFVDAEPWGACAECVALIDARQLTELMNRAVENMILREVIPAEDRAAALARMSFTLLYVLGLSN
jgi:hypothetical protein